MIMRVSNNIKFEIITQNADGLNPKKAINIFIDNKKVVRNAKSLSEAIQKFDNKFVFKK